jgi:hypothetical protein
MLQMYRGFKALVLATIWMMIAVVNLSAQAPDTLWTKTYGGPGNDFGYCLDITYDAGFIIAGSYFQQEGNSDFYLLKTDEQGDTLWTQTYGGDHYDGARCVFQTSDNGYFVAGIDRSYNFGENDIQLFKTDSIGNILWTRSYGGEHEEGITGGQATADGGYIFIGYTASFGMGSMDAWLLRLDADGDTLWTKTYGGENYDSGTSVVQTPDEGYFVLCNINYGFNDQGLTLIKTNPAGDSLWARRYFHNNEFGVSIIPAADSAYLILANTLAVGDEFDIRLIKIEDDGDTLWTSIIGGLEIDIGYSIQQSADNGLLICGSTGPYFDQDIYIMKTNAEGDTVWTKTIIGSQYGNDIGNCIRQTPDGGFVLTGSLSTGDAAQDVFLIKLASDQVGIENESDNSLSYGFRLATNYPNPFNSVTAIEYSLPEESKVTIEIYDILGRKIGTLVQEKQPAGYHQVVWDGKDKNGKMVSTGIYFYELYVDDYRESKAMIMIK